MMRSWTWIVIMAPLMWGLHRLVRWADRLHAWQYSEQYAPPGPVDFTRAAVVFWASLLIPLAAACIAAALAFRRRAPSTWGILEIGTIGLPYVALGAGLTLGVPGFSNGPLVTSDLIAKIVWLVMIWACVVVGGAVVAAGHHLGASIRHRTWGKCAVSLLGICAGMLYLFWLSAFIIYIDT